MIWGSESVTYEQLGSLELRGRRIANNRGEGNVGAERRFLRDTGWKNDQVSEKASQFRLFGRHTANFNGTQNTIYILYWPSPFEQ